MFFANVACEKCGFALGFLPEKLTMLALVPPNGTNGAGQANMQAASGRQDHWRFCENATYGACNWLLPADDASPLCQACRLNDIIPDLSDPDNLNAWQRFERAKKRLIYSLLRFGLPFDASDAGALTFNLGHDTMTGHLDGRISVDIMEADAVERERRRQHFDEPFRTMLGHLRHESGHFYWNVLIDAASRHDDFRQLFGDERADYGEALQQHHDAGPPVGWQDAYVSAYASSHPWEDWAETWAHYLHMVDALETAEVMGIEPRSAGLKRAAARPLEARDVYAEKTFDVLRDRWLPLTIALNALNRSMGHDDFYPFIIPPVGYEKLAFVHSAIRARSVR